MPVYPISPPQKVPQTQKLSLIRKQTVHLSPYNGKQQQTNLYAQWALEFTWPRMSQKDAMIHDGWLTSLQGQQGTFRYVVQQPAYATGYGAMRTTDTAFAFSNTIKLNIPLAAPNSDGTKYLPIGRFITIGSSTDPTNTTSQLVRVTAVGELEGTTATVEFEPALRSQFSTNTLINYTSAYGIFRLNTGETPSSTLDPDHLPEFPTISAIEAL